MIRVYSRRRSGGGAGFLAELFFSGVLTGGGEICYTHPRIPQNPPNPSQISPKPIPTPPTPPTPPLPEIPRPTSQSRTTT